MHDILLDKKTMRASAAILLEEPYLPAERSIGHTPLIRLRKVTEGLPETVSLFAKAEHYNPGGSVKDRPALNIIRRAIRDGALHPGKTLIDATSGNTGIAYALFCAGRNISVKLAIPSNASAERKRILQAYGVELILTDPLEGTDGAQRVVKEMAEASPERFYYADQYNNEANWQAHFEGTGPEILAQSRGRITHFVAGLGTTGTFTGVSRRLKEANPEIRCIGVQPDSPLHGLEGLKHLETALIPGIYDQKLTDGLEFVSTEDAYEMTRRLAREEGLLVGVSSGANVAAAIRIARDLDEGVVVTVLCDTGERYLSDPFWDE